MDERIKLLTDFVNYLYNLGLSVPLIVALGVIVLLIVFPEGASNLKTLIVTPFFHMKRWFARTYISNKISGPVSKFINKDILAYLDGVEEKQLKVKLNFISDTEELKKKKNILIVRLKEDVDQTKNILSAASIVIPSIVCPLVRSNIDPTLSKAIDLTALKKLALKLGAHGKFIYKIGFLDPELLNNPKVNDHIERLVRIDNKGLFISIFANELHYLGEEMFTNSDRSNRTADALNLLEFLIKIAERKIGEKQELSFSSRSINTAIILLALSEKVDLLGVTPYLNRLRRNFNNGAHSVYIVAYPPAQDFLKTLLKTVGHDDRYRIVKTYKLQLDEDNLQTKVSLVRTNAVFSDKEFARELTELGLEVGSGIDGIVIDVSLHRAVVTLAGLNCFIRKEECSWHTVISCTNELDIGQHYNFVIKNIDFSSGTIELSRRFDENDPWLKTEVPQEGDIIEITPQVPLDLHLVCRTAKGLEVKVPMTEIVWGELLEKDVINIIGEQVRAKVLFVQHEGRLIRASIRQLNKNPWEEINKNFPPGTKLLGTVVAKNPQFVTLEISNGVFGRVQKESFFAAGHEYRDFLENLLIAQKLQVEVKKVWVGKEKISLELTRNLEGKATAALVEDVPDNEHKIVKMRPPKKVPKS